MNRKVSQRGFSLVSILVLLSVVSLAMLVASKAYLNRLYSKKIFEEKSSYHQSEAYFFKMLGNKIHRDVDASRANCLKDGRLSFLEEGLEVVDEGVKFAGNGSVDLQRAISQCKKVNYPNKDQNVFEFCLRVKPKSQQKLGFLYNAKDTLIQVRAEMVDLHSLSPMSCVEYTRSKSDSQQNSRGLHLYTHFFWSGSKGELHHKKTAYIAHPSPMH